VNPSTATQDKQARLRMVSLIDGDQRWTIVGVHLFPIRNIPRAPVWIYNVCGKSSCDTKLNPDFVYLGTGSTQPQECPTQTQYQPAEGLIAVYGQHSAKITIGSASAWPATPDKECP